MASDTQHIVTATCQECGTKKPVTLTFNGNWSTAWPGVEKEDRSWAWAYNPKEFVCVCGSVRFKIK